MKYRKIAEIFVLVFFVLLSVFSFRTYFFKNQVPIPFNLLAFLYSPWKYTSWSGYPLGVQNKPLGFDNLKLFYPYRKFTVDELKSGHIPLWNSYVFSGNIHEATYQTAVFYPLNIVYFLLPLADAWSVLVIVQPILVGLFTYVFLRSLSQSKPASLLGATGFAFSGWMIALWEEVLVLVHSLLWLPLALYASNLIWDQKQTKKGFFLLALSLSFSVLAGFLQMSMYVFVTVLAWNFNKFLSEKDKDARRKSLTAVLFGFLTAILVSAIQWLPAFEAYLFSSRGVVNAKFLFDQFLSPITHLITFIVPDFWGNPGSYNYFSPLVYIQERTIYVGIFILLFGLFIYCIRTKREVNFWKVFAVITLSLGFALPTSWIFYALHIPILSVAQPARIFALSTFGLCVLAGYGFDSLENDQSQKIMKKIIYSVGLVLVGLWILVGYFFFVAHKANLIQTCIGKADAFCLPYLYGTISLRNLFLPTVFFFLAWISFKFFFKRKKLFIAIIFGITIVGSLYYANKMLYFSDRQFEYPNIEPITALQKISGYDRVWSYGNGYIIRNMLSYYRIFSPEGYDALYSQRYGELVYTNKTNGKVTDQINRTDVTLGEAGQNEVMRDNPARLRLMSLLGVKYIVEHKEDSAKDELPAIVRFSDNLFTLVWENNEWRIWQYRDVMPRVFIAHNIVVEKNPQKIIDNLYSSNLDLRKTILLEDPISLPQVTDNPQDDIATIDAYESEKVTIKTHTMTAGVLFLSDTYASGWKAYVDGIPVKIYRADYAFRAIPIKSGNHTAVFVYDPLSFKIGFAGTLAGLIGVAVGLLMLKRRTTS